MISDLRSLLAMDKFKLTKWLSLSNKVIQTVPEEERSKSLQNSIHAFKWSSRTGLKNQLERFF